jgi:DNA-binding PadR family transcriptional regulator
MYTSFLSYGTTFLHLEVLRSQRLLDYDDSVKLYKITPKGRQFLELYTKMAEMLEPISKYLFKGPSLSSTFSDISCRIEWNDTQSTLILKGQPHQR